MSGTLACLLLGLPESKLPGVVDGRQAVVTLLLSSYLDCLIGYAVECIMFAANISAARRPMR